MSLFGRCNKLFVVLLSGQRGITVCCVFSPSFVRFCWQNWVKTRFFVLPYENTQQLLFVFVRFPQLVNRLIREPEEEGEESDVSNSQSKFLRIPSLSSPVTPPTLQVQFFCSIDFGIRPHLHKQFSQAIFASNFRKRFLQAIFASDFSSRFCTQFSQAIFASDLVRNRIFLSRIKRANLK